MTKLKRVLLKTVTFLSEIKLFFAITFWLMILLIIGTIEQKEMGLFEVQGRYFSSWFFFFHGIPLPGGMITMGLMFLGLLLHVSLKTKTITRAKLGPLITHIGALVLLGGAFITNFSSVEGSMVLSEGETANFFRMYDQSDKSKARVTLPFSVTLVEFEKKFHPQTRIAKSFKSIIVLHDKDLHQERTISMNEPLRYKGYTFYQASFSENSEGETTDLAVVKNQGRVIPYVATIIISLGLILHLIFNAPKRREESYE